jgi:hypothetical protein
VCRDPTGQRFRLDAGGGADGQDVPAGYQEQPPVLTGCSVVDENAPTLDGRIEDGMLAAVIVEGHEACLNLSRLLEQHGLAEPITLALEPGGDAVCAPVEQILQLAHCLDVTLPVYGVKQRSRALAHLEVQARLAARSGGSALAQGQHVMQERERLPCQSSRGKRTEGVGIVLVRLAGDLQPGIVDRRDETQIGEAARALERAIVRWLLSLDQSRLAEQGLELGPGNLEGDVPGLL